MITDYAEKLTSGSLENPGNIFMKWALTDYYRYIRCGTGNRKLPQWYIVGRKHFPGFFQVIDSIHTGAYETAASTLLSAITPGSIAEENYLFVLDTYLIGMTASVTSPFLKN